MSIRFTPSSTTRRSTALASSGSSGGPQMPVAGDAHRAVAEPADLEVAADREGRSHASETTQRSQEARAPGIASRPMTTTDAPAPRQAHLPHPARLHPRHRRGGRQHRRRRRGAERRSAPLRRGGAGAHGTSHFGDFAALAALGRRHLPGPRRLPRRRADLVGRHLPRRLPAAPCDTASTTTSSPTSRSSGSNEGLLFVNHEYPDPFFLHGYKPNAGAKTPAQVQEEQDSVGNSILHVKKRPRRQLEGGLALRATTAASTGPPAARVHRARSPAPTASAPP